MNFTQDELLMIERLAFELAGNKSKVRQGSQHLAHNIARRMAERGCRTLMSYLDIAQQDKREKAELISALTIHTTGWFREPSHFEGLKRFALDFLHKNRGRKCVLRIWCAASSTGEEIYSAALVCEWVRRSYPDFDYAILGTDIDQVSLAIARRAVYSIVDLEAIPSPYRSLVRRGHGEVSEYFAMSREIRERCLFETLNLVSTAHGSEPRDHLQGRFNIVMCRNVLIYFESHEVESIIQMLGQAIQPGGCLVLGHSEALSHVPPGFRSLGQSTYGKLDKDPIEPLEAAASGVQSGLVPQVRQPIEVICIGASTGGTEALGSLLSGIGRPDLPPVVVVQHMGHSFLPTFAQSLADQARLRLGSIQGGAPLQVGHLYIPVGDYHLGIRQYRNELISFRYHGAPLHSQRPSVDYTFKSIAETRVFTVGILLTGMGKDGAQGLLDLHATGAITMAQDEASAVVFGMPREAIRLGAARYVGSVRDLRRYLDSCLATSQRLEAKKKLAR